MKKSPNLIAFIIALSLHLLIGVVLLMSVEFSLPKENPKEAVSIIHASVVSQQMYDDLAQRQLDAKREEQRKKDNARKAIERKKAEQKRKEALIQKQKEDRIKAERAEKIRQQKEAKRIEAEKIKAAKALQEKKKANEAAKAKKAKELKQKQEAEKKALAKQKEAEKIKAAKIKAEKLAKEKAAKEAKIKAAKAAAAEKERLRQAELDAQMDAEFSDVFSNARSAQQLSEIAKYEALIRGKISRNWKVDPSMRGKSCTLGIRLAPDGLVLSAKMSRGDKQLCSSARRAALQAKTLPIPRDPEIAPKFRDFDITLEPEL
ncbi:cell envelope integrity protein TolA [Psychromonas sp. RZ22]|uniref:cell envelope integrity protein TolA n=1 Tax=Psychromonas algarum TaxID=2555643 RepID=UPI0010686A5D|nr:cell envelope integrity protein TolA [Psychromonas sp. RZ22]TEW53417.1 cell envelope integrity protein TolA [Psychromonas sp. RZ22]